MPKVYLRLVAEVKGKDGVAYATVEVPPSANGKPSSYWLSMYLEPMLLEVLGRLDRGDLIGPCSREKSDAVN